MSIKTHHAIKPLLHTIWWSHGVQMLENRTKVIKCLRYLSQQGIPLQGHNNNGNFTQLLYLLDTKDKNIMDHLDGKVGHKYNHHDVQNELLNIIGA